VVRALGVQAPGPGSSSNGSRGTAREHRAVPAACAASSGASASAAPASAGSPAAIARPQAAAHPRQVRARPAPGRAPRRSPAPRRLAWSARPSPPIAGTITTSSPAGAPFAMLATLLQRQVEQASAVEVGAGRTRGSGPPAPAARFSRLAQRVVVRPAPGVRHDQLAVQHGGSGRHPPPPARPAPAAAPRARAVRIDEPDVAGFRARRPVDRCRAPGGRPRWASNR